MSVEFRQGWGWLVLAALTISTIGDEITLLTLMFRTAENASGYAVPTLLIAELLPGLIAGRRRAFWSWCRCCKRA